jgi:hypothetical protein
LQDGIALTDDVVIGLCEGVEDFRGEAAAKIECDASGDLLRE